MVPIAPSIGDLERAGAEPPPDTTTTTLAPEVCEGVSCSGVEPEGVVALVWVASFGFGTLVGRAVAGRS